MRENSHVTANGSIVAVGAILTQSNRNELTMNGVTSNWLSDLLVAIVAAVCVWAVVSSYRKRRRLKRERETKDSDPPRRTDGES